MPDAGAIAHKAGGKIGDYAPLIIAVLLIGGAIYVYSSSGTTSGYQIVGATNNSAERAAAVQSNAAAVQAHDATIMTGFQALVGEATSQYNSDTQITLGAQGLASQISSYQAAQSIANIQAKAQEYVAAQASAAQQAQAHAAQQNGLWSSIASIFGGVESAFTGMPHLGGGGSSGYTGPGNTGSFGSYG